MAFHCDYCGRNMPNPANITTGYGLDRDNMKVCYPCCAGVDRAAMIERGRAALYLTWSRSDNGYTAPLWVANWPGSLRFEVFDYSTGRHNIAGSRVDVWFIGPDGAVWWGVQYGKNSDIVHCKRTKQNNWWGCSRALDAMRAQQREM